MSRVPRTPPPEDDGQAAPPPGGTARRHAPSLRRTAVMLTGDPVAADRAVVEAFRRAPRATGRDELLEALVRVTVRGRRRRREDHLGVELRGMALGARPAQGLEDRPAPDPGDVLAALRPRERAATVLRLVERWPAGRVGETLRVRRTAVTWLVPRTPGLAEALRSLAERHHRPDAEVVADVLARLGPATGPHVAAEEAAPVRSGGAAHVALRPGRPPVPARAWTWRALAGALALGLVVWAGALTDRPAPAPGPAAGAAGGTGPRDVGLRLADGSVAPDGREDLAARGWVLDGRGDPPVDLEGLRLVEATPVDLRRPDAALSLDTRPRTGQALFGVLWCDLPVSDANLRPPTARLATAAGSAVLPCAGTGGEPPVSRLVPLPPAEVEDRTLARLSWTGDVPERGRALLATYSEAAETPAEAQTDVAGPLLAPGAVAVTADAPTYQVEGRRVHHQQVRLGASSTVTVWAGGAGAVAVQLDDTLLTDDGEAAAGGTPSLAWRTADPELRGGSWLAHRPQSVRHLELPPGLAPSPGRTRVATVSVSTTLPDGSWQVHVGGAQPVAPAATVPLPLIVPAPDVPEWVAGHRLAAAWLVPSDGTPHALRDPGLRPGRRFVLVGAAAGGGGPLDVVVPHVATTRGAADVTVVQEVADAFDESIWRPGDLLLRAGASTEDIRTGVGTGVESVVAPAAVAPAPPAVLLAYEPVAFEDFAFGAAPPLGVSRPLADAGPAAAPTGAAADEAPGAPPEGAVVAGRWTREDLDEEGRLVLDAELTGRTWLRLTTEGPGRVQVLEGGRPALWLPDGWWTSWTAEPVVTDVRVEGTRGGAAPGRPLELRVEGWRERFAVEVLVRPGEG